MEEEVPPDPDDFKREPTHPLGVQTQGSSPYFSPIEIDRVLDENAYLLETVESYQSSTELKIAIGYQRKAHENLMFLVRLLDATAIDPNINENMISETNLMEIGQLSVSKSPVRTNPTKNATPITSRTSSSSKSPVAEATTTTESHYGNSLTTATPSQPSAMLDISLTNTQTTASSLPQTVAQSSAITMNSSSRFLPTLPLSRAPARKTASLSVTARKNQTKRGKFPKTYSASSMPALQALRVPLVFNNEFTPDVQLILDSIESSISNQITS